MGSGSWEGSVQAKSLFMCLEGRGSASQAGRQAGGQGQHVMPSTPARESEPRGSAGRTFANVGANRALQASVGMAVGMRGKVS